MKTKRIPIAECNGCELICADGYCITDWCNKWERLKKTPQKEIKIHTAKEIMNCESLIEKEQKYIEAANAFLDDLDERYDIKSIDAYKCPFIREMAKARKELEEKWNIKNSNKL